MVYRKWLLPKEIIHAKNKFNQPLRGTDRQYINTGLLFHSRLNSFINLHRHTGASQYPVSIRCLLF